MHSGKGYYFLAPVLILFSLVTAEPVVFTGEMVQSLLGKPVDQLRMCNSRGEPIPFQVDEITVDGEYVCPEGVKPNTDSGNGILDKQDEIVFLYEDALPFSLNDSGIPVYGVPIVLKQGSEQRRVFLSDDYRSIELSEKKYIQYDHKEQIIQTPYYYAQFGKDRFHFTKAGVRDLGTGNKFIDLTNELRIEILLKALWGLIPIRYSEENIVCLVKRYKTGPLRLIRRGDFHLNLGMGIKGSRAAVNQICYPQIVKVPVYIHVPIRFRALFGDAYLEMTPVIKKHAGPEFSFRIPQSGFSAGISGTPLDTMIRLIPNNKFMAVTDGLNGYGWLLQAKIADSLLEGSSFVFRRPSSRSGSAECGFRMTIRDLPKGYYEITNWVMFPLQSYEHLCKILHQY